MMKKLYLAAISIIMVSLGAAATSDATVQVSPLNKSTFPNDTISYSIEVLNGTEGVGAVDAQIELDSGKSSGDTENRIQNFSLEGNPGMKTVNTTQNGLSTSLDAALMNTSENISYEIANFEIKIDNKRSTQIDLTVDALGTEEGASYNVNVWDGNLEVEIIPKLKDSYTGKPRDYNGDGVYKDLNGDGKVDIVDVQALYKTRSEKIVQKNIGAFDMNEDGEVDIVDVQRLYDSLQ